MSPNLHFASTITHGEAAYLASAFHTCALCAHAHAKALQAQPLQTYAFASTSTHKEAAHLTHAPCVPMLMPKLGRLLPAQPHCKHCAGAVQDGQVRGRSGSGRCRPGSQPRSKLRWVHASDVPGGANISRLLLGAAQLSPVMSWRHACCADALLCITRGLSLQLWALCCTLLLHERGACTSWGQGRHFISCCTDLQRLLGP